MKNMDKKMSVVLKFDENDLDSEPIERVVYALSPRVAMVYYIMQFVKKNFMWEKYPKHIDGIFSSAKVKDIWYYDKLDGVILVSRPMTDKDRKVQSERTVRKEQMKRRNNKKCGV